MEIKIKKLQKILKIKFNDINLLIQAITHKSYDAKKKLRNIRIFR